MIFFFQRMLRKFFRHDFFPNEIESWELVTLHPELVGFSRKDIQRIYRETSLKRIVSDKIDALATLRGLGIPVDRYVVFENDCLLPKEWVGDDAQMIASSFWKLNRKYCDQLLKMVCVMNPKDTMRFADLHVPQKDDAFIYTFPHKLRTNLH